MKKLTTNVLTALGFVAMAATVGLWSAPKLIGAIAAIKAALVQNVDEPGRNPYQESVNATCNSTTDCLAVFKAVPAGKRLVVTAVSTEMRILPGPGRRYVLLGSRDFIPSVSLPSYYQGSSGGVDSYFVAQTVLAYFEAGDHPQMEVAADAGGLSTPPCRLFGYYITLP